MDNLITSRKRELFKIYSRFEEDVSAYRRDAVCRKGCSFCCTFMGNVDITTLEGVIIREQLSSFSPGQRSLLYSRIDVNRTEKERGGKSPCPFLDEEYACSIYEVRPFSCRQLYSMTRCNGAGATIHRQAYELSRRVITRIQRLDDNGYSGHLSFILFLLDDAEFRDVYLAGKFEPDSIRDFGRSHGMVINRRTKGGGP